MVGLVEKGYSMTYKQIETSREIRLWATQIIMPAILTASVLLANDDIRKKASEKLSSAKEYISNKIHH